MLTDQNVFDNALQGVRAQRYKQSWNTELHMCCYRGPGGLKCGVGHSIPDDVYRPFMDTLTAAGTSIGLLLTRDNDDVAPLKALFAGVDRNLLAALQGAHDRGLCAYPGARKGEEFEHEMLRVAKRFGLTYTPAVHGA